MGFGFNLVGFPLLILASVGLIIYFLIKKKKIAIKLLVGLWVLTIIVFCLGLFMAKSRKSIRLTKQDIVGDYRIEIGRAHV